MLSKGIISKILDLIAFFEVATLKRGMRSKILDLPPFESYA